MLQLLIKKNEYIQLKILVALTNKVTTKKRNLDTLLNLNTASAYTHITSLNKDLTELFGDNAVKIVLEGNNLSTQYLSDIRDHHIFKKLIQKHFSVSTSFTYFKELASQKIPIPLLETLDRLSISESYLNKLIKSFNTFFQDAHINIRKKKHQLQLCGPPQNIILLKYYLTYFITSFEDASDLPVDSSSHLTQPPQPSNTRNTLWNAFRTNILSTVLATDSTLLPRVKITDDTSLTFLNILYKEKNLLDLNNDTKESPTQPNLYLNFSLHFIQPNALNEDEKKNIVSQIINEDIPLLSEISSYLKSVIDDLDISHEKFMSLDLNFQLYNYFLTIMNIHIHKVNFKKYFEIEKEIFIQPDTLKSYTDISPYFSNTALAHLSDDAKFIIQENKEYFIPEFYALSTKSDQDNIININIDYIFQPALAPCMKEKLAHTFNMDTINFVTDINQTDLVISDYLIEVPPNIPLFIILDNHSKKHIVNSHLSFCRFFKKRIQVKLPHRLIQI